MIRFAALTIISLLFLTGLKAQYTSYKISPTGDTLNAVDKKGLKQGKWVISVGEIRGEPGYDEEGIFKNDKREGPWRRYTAQGDLIAYENYKYGGKDGIQKYFNYLGQLEREEAWHAYNPESPYDTIPVYGTDNDQIVKYNIVKAVQYSVPDGEWKYYEPETGAVNKIEKYRRGLLLKDDPKENPDLVNNASDTTNANKTNTVSNAKDKPKDKPKPPEVLEYEKKLSKKKRAALTRTGETGP